MKLFKEPIKNVVLMTTGIIKMSFYADEGLDNMPNLFVYGQEKAKKTLWCCMMAFAGFNVTLFDADDGALIIKARKPDGSFLIPLEIQKRIGVINLVQRDGHIPSQIFLAAFLRPGGQFIWDLVDRVCVMAHNMNPEHDHLAVDASKLTTNDFPVMDSFSAIARDMSEMYAKENRIDMFDAKKTEWDGYGWEGRYLTLYVKRWKTLRCPKAIIGHATVYEKRAKDGKTIISQETQPISSSGPHAKTLAKDFSDVLYFTRASETAYFINTGGAGDRVGGCRSIPPQNFQWDNLPPWSFTENAGIIGDMNKQSEAFVYYAKGVKPANAPVQQVGLLGSPKLATQTDALKVLSAAGQTNNPLAALMKK